MYLSIVDLSVFKILNYFLQKLKFVNTSKMHFAGSKKDFGNFKKLIIIVYINPYKTVHNVAKKILILENLNYI